MGISYDPTKGLFHLRSPGSSYVLQVLETGLVAHVFWGGALRQPVELGRIAPQLFGEAPATPVLGEAPYPRLSLDLLPQEYPAYGRTDFREPAYQVALDDGSTVTDLRYQSHQIYPGKRPLVGLPATFVERGEDAESLDLTLADEHAGLEVVLTYTVYRELNVVTRSARFTNKGSRRLRLLPRSAAASTSPTTALSSFSSRVLGPGSATCGGGRWCRGSRPSGVPGGRAVTTRIPFLPSSGPRPTSTTAMPTASAWSTAGASSPRRR